MKKKYVKPETMTVATDPVVICAGSPENEWTNDGDHGGNVYPSGGGNSGFNEDDWGQNN